MASEIRVDKINSLSGVGTVTLSPTGVDIAGITTAATLRATTGIVTSLTAVSSAKVGSGVTLSPDGDIFATGVTTATTFVGALTGNVTGNTSGTAGGLTGTPNISCGTIAGSTGTFSGDVNVGAGITLDASAGIVTAANEVSAGRISMLTVNTGGRLITSGAFLTIQAATGTVIEDLDGNNQIKGNDGGSVQLYHNGTEQCATSANGLAFPSGKGIDFSATSDASGMSNELLDDYEEGTFTPTFYYASGTSGVAYSVQEGRYTKVGRLVSFQLRVALTSKGSGNNNVRIGGLPFTPQAAGVNYDIFHISVIVGCNLGSARTPFAQLEDYSSGGRITLYSFDYGSASDYAEINSGHLDNDFTCSLQGNYITAS